MNKGPMILGAASLALVGTAGIVYALSDDDNPCLSEYQRDEMDRDLDNIVEPDAECTFGNVVELHRIKTVKGKSDQHKLASLVDMYSEDTKPGVVEGTYIDKDGTRCGRFRATVSEDQDLMIRASLDCDPGTEVFVSYGPRTDGNSFKTGSSPSDRYGVDYLIVKDSKGKVQFEYQHDRTDKASLRGAAEEIGKKIADQVLNSALFAAEERYLPCQRERLKLENMFGVVYEKAKAAKEVVPKVEPEVKTPTPRQERRAKRSTNRKTKKVLPPAPAIMQAPAPKQQQPAPATGTTGLHTQIIIYNPPQQQPHKQKEGYKLFRMRSKR